MGLSIISRLAKTTFFKSVSTMLVGSFFSQLFPVLASPILTRIYTPQSFGIFALFLSSCTIITILATGNYEVAILKMKKHKQVLNLCFFIIVLSFIISVFVFLIIYIFSRLNFFFFRGTKFLDLLFIPLGLFLNSLFQITSYYLTWKSNFLLLNKIKILQSVVIVLISIVLGYYTDLKDTGLIIGYIAGFLVSAVPLVYYIYTLKKYISLDLAFNLVKEYKNYPMMVMPSAFINNLASQLPIFYIKKYFEKSSVGEYSLTNRMLIAPVSLISVSIGQVYFKIISDKSNRKESLYRSFYGTFVGLSILSIIVFTPLFLWGENIVVLIFGNKWQMAGELSEILSIAILIKFIVSPLSSIFYAINATSVLSKWQLSYFSSSLLLFSFIPTDSFVLFLKGYVIHEIVWYSIYFFMMIVNLNKYERIITS